MNTSDSFEKNSEEKTQKESPVKQEKNGMPATGEDQGKEEPFEAAEQKLIRLQADFANYEKRMAKEKTEWVMRANEALLLGLLPVVNDFQRALEAAEGDPKEVLQGLSLIREKLFSALEREGVKMISIGEGEKVTNEDEVEVVSMMKVEEGKKGKVIKVVEQGYLYRGRVLQRAKVIIGQ